VTVPIEHLAREDPLTYGISYVNLLQKQEWTLVNRKWSEAIYEAVNPVKVARNPDSEKRQMALIKPTQIGMSTMALVKMFHFADFWPTRTIYMLPRQQDYLDFVNTRIDPMISTSSRLRSKLGSPDSTRAKGFSDSYLFFMESTVEPRMMPADMLMVDEIDLCNPDHVGTATNRLDNSEWKLRFYFGTPTISNYGAHGRYMLSNQNVWQVKCPGCNTWQEMDWEENLRVVGKPHDPDDLFLGCTQCNHRFTLHEINEYGTWVPKKPHVKDIVGFRMSQLMVFPLEQVYANWIDPEQDIVEFYRKRLGKTYETAGGSVSREDILSSCFWERYPEELFYMSGSKYYMGVDQGNELQVVIGKMDRGSNVLKVVHIELIPYETSDGTPAGFHRVEQLIKQYRIQKTVVDGNPNRHKVKDLQKNNPGKVVIADYTNIKERFTKKKDNKNVLIGLSLNRTMSLDNLMESIRNGDWGLFGDPSNLPVMVDTLINHVTALKRDIEKRKKLGGVVEEAAVWRTLRPDHLAHCMVYLKTAVEVSGSRVGRIAVIGQSGVEKEVEVDLEGYYPTQDTIARLSPVLSQVRQDQALIYFEQREEDDFDIANLPMPLRHCLNNAVKQEFEWEDIDWILRHIADFDNKAIKLPTEVQKRIVRIA
jgi:hypothetical protein